MPVPAGGAPEPAFGDFWTQRFSGGGLPVTQAVSQRIGAVLAYIALRLRLSPTAVTLAGGFTFLVTMLLYVVLPGGLLPTAVCILLLQFGFGLDCADGQLARATVRTSAFGAWLDLATDYWRNVLLAFGIVLWGVHTVQSPLPLAMLAGGLLLIGNVLVLHNVTMRKVFRVSDRIEQALEADSRPWHRKALRLLLDTPVYLLIIGVLREFPNLLLLFAGVYGSTAFLMSIRVARKCFQGPVSHPTSQIGSGNGSLDSEPRG